MKQKSQLIIAGEEVKEDRLTDSMLRPKTLNEFVGQKKLKESLLISIKAAKERGEPIDHLLFSGAPGLGKTSLSYIIAREEGVNIKVTSGPALQRVADLAAILTNLEKNDILFIDEIHRLNRIIEEALYPVMEEFGLDLILGKGPGAKILRLNLSSFTLIGATTRPSLLSSPLRDRFGFFYQLNYYNLQEIEEIVKRSAYLLNIEIENEATKEIAIRARFTPRVANRFLKRVRDFAQVKKRKIDKDLVDEALSMFEIDNKGLTETDRRVLKMIIEKFNGGPVGLKNLSVTLNEDIFSLEDIYEPYLLQIGFLERTPRGRKATKEAYKYLGYEKGLF